MITNGDLERYLGYFGGKPDEFFWKKYHEDAFTYNLVNKYVNICKEYEELKFRMDGLEK